MTRRVFINLIALGLVAAAIFVYLIADLLSDALFEDTYPIVAELPDSGGLIASQEVTLAGRVVGQVAEVDLTEDRVFAVLDILADEQIPTNTDTVILRRSSIGEQAFEFVPQGEPTGFYEAGDTIDALDTRMPVKINELLESQEQAFGAIDPETAAELVGELADAVRGRRSSIRDLISNSADFSETMADGDEDWDRLFREGRTVTAALRDVRGELGESVVLMADSAAILSDMRTDFEALLLEAPPALAQVGGVVSRAQPNISCLLGHFAEFNAFLGTPTQMEEAERAFRANQWFLVGYPHILKAFDEDGRKWNRVHVYNPTADGQEDIPPERYPVKRPIPPTLPGGACESPFGSGAAMATQPDHTIFVPEGRIIPPENARATPVRAGGPPLSQAGAPRAGARFARDDTLPATGGAGLATLTGLLLLGGAWVVRRRTGSAAARHAKDRGTQ